MKPDKKMIFNAFKISAGCVIAMFMASLLGLKYNITAGLITVLSIQDTKRETVKMAVSRLLAFFCAFFTALICFEILGYTKISFGIYLFIFTIICIVSGWKNAIVPISVLVTHVLGEKSSEPELILNELLLFSIGAGTGILLNLHLKQNKIKMNECRQKLDDEIKAILQRMSQRILKDDKSDYNSDCFKKLDILMFEAQNIAYQNRDNAFMKIESYDIDYLKMRKNQCSVLYEMYKSILNIKITPEQAGMISDFMLKISEEYHENNDVIELIQELDNVFAKMKMQKMPETREEFENRAVLYSLMLDIREFLHFKYEFMNKNY